MVHTVACKDRVKGRAGEGIDWRDFVFFFRIAQFSGQDPDDVETPPAI